MYRWLLAAGAVLVTGAIVLGADSVPLTSYGGGLSHFKVTRDADGVNTVHVNVDSIPAGGGASGDTDVTDRIGRLLGHVTIDNAALAVTGAFFQATQPVSGTFWQATQPVSGTFWQATQPVSLATAPTTPVTGTFWQATQPVSGPLTDAQLRAAAVPVSGAFFQATQPVSGTFWQATQPVSGTFWQATQPISAAALPLPTNAAIETGNLQTLAGKDFATSAKQDTANTSLASLDTKTTLGNASVAQARAVTVAADQRPLATIAQVPLTGRITSTGRISR